MAGAMLRGCRQSTCLTMDMTLPQLTASYKHNVAAFAVVMLQLAKQCDLRPGPAMMP